MSLIQIKNRYTGAVIYEGEGETLRQVVESSVAARANLADANLADANLARANLADAYLADAYLAGANLADAYLAGANLARAYLADAYLAGANLARAYLAGANLADANLAGANLADANLAGANLADANLADAKWTESLVLTMSPVQVSGLKYRVTMLNGTHMQIGCKLYELGDWCSFSDEQICAMDGQRAIEFWRQWKEPLLAMARNMAAEKVTEQSGV